MEAIFSVAADVPQWFKDQARRMRDLAKVWKSQMVEMFGQHAHTSKPIKEWTTDMQMEMHMMRFVTCNVAAVVH